MQNLQDEVKPQGRGDSGEAGLGREVEGLVKVTHLLASNVLSPVHLGGGEQVLEVNTHPQSLCSKGSSVLIMFPMTAVIWEHF